MALRFPFDPRTQGVSVRMPRPLFDMIKRMAESEYRSFNSMIVALLYNASSAQISLAKSKEYAEELDKLYANLTQIMEAQKIILDKINEMSKNKDK